MKQHTLCRLVVRLLLAIIACVSPAQAKHADDVVILKNGDRLTGEIKGLQRGELKFKASYMAEAVRLDWAKVERLEEQINISGLSNRRNAFYQLCTAGSGKHH